MAKFELADLLRQLRQAVDSKEPVKRVRETMRGAFDDPAAIRAAMPAYDEDDVILYEDDSLSVWFVRFVPGLHVPPHDHQTNATIGVYEGAEDNHFYQRENGRLRHISTRRVKPGDVIAMKPDAIHSVEAANAEASCGIHVYLDRLSTIERSLFDWQTGEPRPFTDDNYDAMKRRAD